MIEFFSLFVVPFLILITYLIWIMQGKPKKQKCSYCLVEWRRPLWQEEIYLGKDKEGNSVLVEVALCNSCYKGYLFNPEGFLIEIKGLMNVCKDIVAYTKESE